MAHILPKPTLNAQAINRRLLPLAMALLAALVAKPCAAGAPTLHVPGDFPTIQAAVNAASPDSIIVVAPGEYAPFSTSGKSLSIQSELGPHLTTIRSTLGPSVDMGPDAELIGFTITGGGAGVVTHGPNNLVRGNIFENIFGQSPGLEGNVSGVTIDGNVFRKLDCNDNYNDSIIDYSNRSNVVLRNNVFHDNDCTAMDISVPIQATINVVNNAFVGNRRAILIDRRIQSSGFLIRNNIVVNNLIGVEAEFGQESSNPTFENNLVFGNTTNYQNISDQTGRNGNLSANPQFIDPFDFRLRPTSPAIDAGSAAAAPTVDFRGNNRPTDGNADSLPRHDIGASEYFPGQSTSRAPFARPDAARTNQENAVFVPLLANDETGRSNVPLNPATISLTTPPANGNVTIDVATGEIRYQPLPGFYGNDVFRYTVRDHEVIDEQAEFVSEYALTRALVPPNGNLGTAWTGGNEPFNDSAWLAGSLGAGYDRATSPVNFRPEINLSLDSMYLVNASAYLRIPFEVEHADAIAQLAFTMRYEDGFVAYINGVRAASANAPSVLAFDSTALAARADDLALVPTPVSITPEARAAIREGVNILAIHALNAAVDSSDLLMRPEIIATLSRLGLLSNEAEVSIYVNARPIAEDDAADLRIGQPIHLEVLANDTDPDATQFNLTSLQIIEPPSRGQLVVNPNGTITYTSSVPGTDTFSYQFQDLEGALSNPAVVTLMVAVPEPSAFVLMIVGIVFAWPRTVRCLRFDR